MKRIAIAILAHVVLCFAFASVAQAQDSPDPSGTPPPVTGIIDTNQYDFNKSCAPDGNPLQTGLDSVLTRITAPSIGIAGRSFQVANGIFFFVGAFAFYWFMVKTVRQTRNPWELFSTQAMKMLMFAVFFLLMNFAAGNDGGTPGAQRVETWAGKIAATIGGQSNAPQTSGQIAATGVCVAYKVFAIPLVAITKKANAEANGQPVWDQIRIWSSNLAAMLLVLLLDIIAALVTLLAYMVLAFQTFIVDYTAQVLAVAAIFILGFSASPWTLPLSEPYWRLVWSTAIFKFTLVFSAAMLSAFATYSESNVLAGLANPGEGGAQPLLPILWVLFAMTFALAIVMNVPKIAQSFLSGGVALGGRDMIGAGLAAGMAGAASAGTMVGAIRGLTAAAQFAGAGLSQVKKALQGAGGGVGEGDAMKSVGRNIVGSGLTENLTSASTQRGSGRSSSSSRDASSDSSRQSPRPDATSARQNAGGNASPSPESRSASSQEQTTTGRSQSQIGEQQRQRSQSKRIEQGDATKADATQPGGPISQFSDESGEAFAHEGSADAISSDALQSAEAIAAAGDVGALNDATLGATGDDAAAASTGAGSAAGSATRLARSEAILAAVSQNLEAAAAAGDLGAIASSARVLAATGAPVTSALAAMSTTGTAAARASQVRALTKAAGSISRAAVAAEKAGAPPQVRAAIAQAASQVARASSATGTASGARLGSATSALSGAAKATAATPGIAPEITAALAESTTAVGSEVATAPMALDAPPQAAPTAVTSSSSGRASSQGSPQAETTASEPPPRASEEVMFERLTRQFSDHIGDHLRDHADRTENAMTDLASTFRDAATPPSTRPEKPAAAPRPRGEDWRDRRRRFQRDLEESLDSPSGGPGVSVTHLSHRPH